MKHTPSPWSVHGDKETLVGADHLKMMLAEVLWEHVCTEWGRPLEEAQANARLIAAAPELLEACKAFLAIPYPSVGQDMSYQTAQDIQKHRMLARSAIAKAEGRAE